MTAHTNNPLLGIFWMLVTGLCFVAVTALVKFMGTRIPPAEAAFLRYLLGLVFLLPAIPALRAAAVTKAQWGMFALRGAVHTIAVALWFYAMTRIPLAEVTAMNYLAPVYVSLGAALFLGERIAARRIGAILVALIGVVIILRPGFREVETGHLAMLFCAMFFAGSYLLAKLMTRDIAPSVIVGMLSIFSTIGLGPLAAMNWVTPNLPELAILFLVACFATAGHFSMTKAFAAAPVTVTQPVTFLQLVWAVAVGAIFFAEPIDGWVIAGGAMTLSAVVFITWREAVLKKRAITPPVPATKI